MSILMNGTLVKRKHIFACLDDLHAKVNALREYQSASGGGIMAFAKSGNLRFVFV